MKNQNGESVEQILEEVAMQGVAAVASGSAPVEYLRRNLVIAKACGAKAEIKITAERLKNTKRVPKWLIASLAAMQVRVEDLPHELAQWRDAAPDNPYLPNAEVSDGAGTK